jgi:chromosome segregation ATPase
MTEVLGTKETQLAVLRMRLDEADRKLELEKQRVTDLQAERDRILVDHSSSAGFHSQALDSLQEKLNEVETSLRHEIEQHRKSAEEATEKLNKSEAERQKFGAEVGLLHRSLDKEKAHSAELASQLKTARNQAELAKQELVDYKEKAARILQSKEKLIASLKEGSATSASGKTGAESTALLSELEGMRQERDMLHDELRASQHIIENLRTELAEVEAQLQQDSEVSRDQISSLEDQLQSERHRREDSEMEVNKQKQELRYVHEELLKQKTAFQQRIQDRENEISRLRSQLTTKTVNASSQEELENRLHSLTESLIQKQTMLEALSMEKSSLLLQLEKTEKKYREAEASALRASSATVNMMDNDEVRQRLPSFMNESPFDGRVTRRVKMAANVIDKFSVRLGVFLRRYPIARVFIIIYMGLLHLWVMIVLLTYQPEMHHGDVMVPHEPH